MGKLLPYDSILLAGYQGQVSKPTGVAAMACVENFTDFYASRLRGIVLCIDSIDIIILMIQSILTSHFW